MRKGTHFGTEPIRVLRLRCPPCRKTRSVLPDGLPPISRWTWSDILFLGGRLAVQTPYAVAKSVGESLASLIRLKSWIVKAGAVVLELATHLGLAEKAKLDARTTPCLASLALARRFSSWAEFTHSFSRALYPKRFPLLSSHTIPTG